MDWYVNDNAPELSSWVVNERNRRTELGIDPYRQACRLIERDIAQVPRGADRIVFNHGKRLG